MHFKTKMNKLLFNANFLLFKQSCYSISGMRYKIYAFELNQI
jgi:hypothetical protein